MSERAVPFHCPYCGDENLWPHEPAEGTGHGQWECRSCLRAFAVKMLGQIRPGLDRLDQLDQLDQRSGS